MKTGAIMCNSGHFDNEINVRQLEKLATKKRRIRPYFDEFTVGKNKLFLAGEGRLVNLACAEGHPSAVMSTSFCGQALSCEFLVKNKGKLKADVIQLPKELDDHIAELQLKDLGVTIDVLTEEQKKYLSSWEEGT